MCCAVALIRTMSVVLNFSVLFLFSMFLYWLDCVVLFFTNFNKMPRKSWVISKIKKSSTFWLLGWDYKKNTVRYSTIKFHNTLLNSALLQMCIIIQTNIKRVRSDATQICFYTWMFYTINLTHYFLHTINTYLIILNNTTLFFCQQVRNLQLVTSQV